VGPLAAGGSLRECCLMGGDERCSSVRGGGAGTIPREPPKLASLTSGNPYAAEVSCPSPIKEARAAAFAKSPTPPPWLRPYLEVQPKTNDCSVANGHGRAVQLPETAAKIGSQRDVPVDLCRLPK